MCKRREVVSVRRGHRGDTGVQIRRLGLRFDHRPLASRPSRGRASRQGAPLGAHVDGSLSITPRRSAGSVSAARSFSLGEFLLPDETGSLAPASRPESVEGAMGALTFRALLAISSVQGAIEASRASAVHAPLRR